MWINYTTQGSSPAQLTNDTDAIAAEQQKSPFKIRRGDPWGKSFYGKKKRFMENKSLNQVFEDTTFKIESHLTTTTTRNIPPANQNEFFARNLCNSLYNLKTFLN